MTEANWEYKLVDYLEGNLTAKEEKQWLHSTFQSKSKKNLSTVIDLKRDLFLLENLSLEPIPQGLYQKIFGEKNLPRIVLELMENTFHLIENTLSSIVQKEVLNYRDQFYEVERMLFPTQTMDLLLIPLSQSAFTLEIHIHPKKNKKNDRNDRNTKEKTDKKAIGDFHLLQLFELLEEPVENRARKKPAYPPTGKLIASFKTPEKSIQIQNIPQGDYLLEMGTKKMHIHIHSKRP